MTAIAMSNRETCETARALKQSKSTQPGPAVRYVTEPRDFGQIRFPAVQLILWERQLPHGLEAWLDSLPPDCCPHGRLLVHAADVREACTKIFLESGVPADPLREVFLADLVAVIDLFAETMVTDMIDIRLETVTSDACWKFHRDCVPARLLTTYRGPGTEWVLPQHGESALDRQKRFPGPVQQFAKHAVGLFKGSLADDGRGIVHRSPPISGTGTTRILLCLNLPSAASPLPWTP